MKSIKKGEVVKRVADSESESFIKAGWNYISKTEWREKRPAKLDKKKSIKGETKKGKKSKAQ